jgi:hypothetical protein
MQMGLRSAPSKIQDVAGLVRVKQFRTEFQERQTWSSGKTIPFRYPLGTVSKRFLISVRGYFQVTFTGLPIFDEAGFLGRIIQRIDVLDGGTTIKSIDPTLARRMAHLINGKPFRRRYATSAAVPTTTTMTTEASLAGAPMTCPATTQWINFEEELIVDFEDPLAYAFGKQGSLWSTKGKNNCRVNVVCSFLKNLEEAGGSSDCVYSNDNITMSITPIDVPYVVEDPKNPFWVLKETLIPFRIPTGSQDYGFDLPTGGLIVGAGLLVRNSATTKKLSDTAVKNWKILANNSHYLLNADFRELQGINVDEFGCADNLMANGRHSLQGFAYYNARADGLSDGARGIPTDNLSTIKMLFDTRGSSDGDPETGNIDVIISLQELRTSA